MKTPDHRFRKVLIILGANIVISWLIGYLLKDWLIKLLSPPIYYQLVIFISLMVAPSVNLLYIKYIDSALKKKEDSLKAQLDPTILDGLKGEEKKYAESLLNPNMETSEQLRRLMAERDAFEKSR